jgi:spore maturation protein SpmB
MQKFCPGSRNLPHEAHAAEDEETLASVIVAKVLSRSGAYGLFTNLLRRHNSTTSHGQMSPVRIHHADRPVS